MSLCEDNQASYRLGYEKGVKAYRRCLRSPDPANPTEMWILCKEARRVGLLLGLNPNSEDGAERDRAAHFRDGFLTPFHEVVHGPTWDEEEEEEEEEEESSDEPN